MSENGMSFGPLLRTWRRRRSLSQLALATDAEISQRHLSFMESGRSAPSREMVVRLVERLSVPLRERNALLIAAGFAPTYPERSTGDPGFAAARQAIELILKGVEPFPALAVDRHWNIVLANTAVAALIEGIDSSLLNPPANALRVSLHPEGLAPRIANIRQWRTHVFARLARQIDNSADPVLTALLEELKNYPVPPGAVPYRSFRPESFHDIAVPLQIRRGRDILSFICTTTVFGTALDVTLSELAIESFLPADDQTASQLIEARKAPVRE